MGCSEDSETMGASGEGNGNPLQYSCPKNPTDRMRRQKDMTLEDETSRPEGVQRATGEEQRSVSNSSGRNGAAGPKQELWMCQWWMCLVVNVIL